MRQIYCADKECELLPAGQTGGGFRSDHNYTESTGGLIPEAQESSIPLESLQKPQKKKRKIQKGGAKNTIKRLKRVQIGEGKKKTVKRLRKVPVGNKKCYCQKKTTKRRAIK